MLPALCYYVSSRTRIVLAPVSSFRLNLVNVQSSLRQFDFDSVQNVSPQMLAEVMKGNDMHRLACDSKLPSAIHHDDMVLLQNEHMREWSLNVGCPPYSITSMPCITAPCWVSDAAAKSVRVFDALKTCYDEHVRGNPLSIRITVEDKDPSVLWVENAAAAAIRLVVSLSMQAR